MSNDETELLVWAAAAGERDAWPKLVAACHGRLRRMVAVRLDQRLAGRIDRSAPGPEILT